MPVELNEYVKKEEYDELKERVQHLENFINKITSNLKPLRGIHYVNDDGHWIRMYHTDESVIQEQLQKYGFKDDGQVGYILTDI